MQGGFGPFNLCAVGIIFIGTVVAVLTAADSGTLIAAVGILGVIAGYVRRRASGRGSCMQRIGYPFKTWSMLVLTALFFVSNAQASNCGMLSYAVDDASTKLKRAANETDFEAAKDYARRARSALDDAAMAAMDCKCTMAYNEFDTAASRARTARDADTVEEFVDSLNRSIRSFNSALNALRACSRERQ